VQIGPNGALLSEIKVALESHPVTMPLFTMAVTIDTRIFVADGLSFSLSGGGSGNDYLYGGAGNDTQDGVDDDNTLIGQGGADFFVLNRDATGVSTVTDFNKSEGDHVLVYTSSGESPKASLSDLGLAVHAHGSADTKITNASDPSDI